MRTAYSLSLTACGWVCLRLAASRVCSVSHGVCVSSAGVFPHKARHAFGLGKNTSRRVFRSYVRALAEMYRREYPRPTQREVFDSTPLDFTERAGRDDVEMILDATGIQVSHPSNPDVGRHLWSK